MGLPAFNTDQLIAGESLFQRKEREMARRSREVMLEMLDELGQISEEQASMVRYHSGCHSMEDLLRIQALGSMIQAQAMVVLAFSIIQGEEGEDE